jgi:UDP-N-acetylmuramoylalanine--D-glutamate ligase
VIFFSSSQPIPGGIYLEGDHIVSELDGEKEIVVSTGELNILGRHNYENVMAAVAVCRKMGVPMEKIRHGCKAFQAVEHRIEFVKEVQGVAYYNDSKGTNPDAAIQAVRAMTRPTILIGGGYDKNSEYEEWIAEFPGRVKLLILLGQTANKIAATARRMGFTDIVYADDMADAVSIANSYGVKGDAVLLSPACASWGMFKNYEERGRIFKELVRNL